MKDLLFLLESEFYLVGHLWSGVGIFSYSFDYDSGCHTKLDVVSYCLSFYIKVAIRNTVCAWSRTVASSDHWVML